MAVDRLAVDKAKAGLLAALKIIKNQPGQGIDCPGYDEVLFKDIYAVAILEIIRDSQGKITMARYRGKPTLCWTAMSGQQDNALANQLQAQKFFVTPDMLDDTDDLKPLDLQDMGSGEKAVPEEGPLE